MSQVFSGSDIINVAIGIEKGTNHGTINFERGISQGHNEGD